MGIKAILAGKSSGNSLTNVTASIPAFVEHQGRAAFGTR